MIFFITKCFNFFFFLFGDFSIFVVLWHVIYVLLIDKNRILTIFEAFLCVPPLIFLYLIFMVTDFKLVEGERNQVGKFYNLKFQVYLIQVCDYLKFYFLYWPYGMKKLIVNH